MKNKINPRQSFVQHLKLLLAKTKTMPHAKVTHGNLHQ